MANAENPWKNPKHYVASVGLSVFEMPSNPLLFMPIPDIQP
jgi:hypothetical protein